VRFTFEQFQEHWHFQSYQHSDTVVWYSRKVSDWLGWMAPLQCTKCHNAIVNGHCTSKYFDLHCLLFAVLLFLL